MKKSFSLIEVIFIISLLGIIATYGLPKNNISKIKLAKNQLLLHLKYTRYIAMLDNKYDLEKALWYKQRWNMKFLNCQESIGGIYYAIYSDEDMNGQISKEETLQDPLTNEYIYSYQCTKDSLYDKSKFVLLSETYGVDFIDISCNETSTIGQIIFDHDGKVYTKHNENIEKYEIKEPCTIKLSNKNNENEIITIYPNSGFIEG